MMSRTRSIFISILQILLVYSLTNRVVIADEVVDSTVYHVQEITSGNFVHLGNFPPQSTLNHGDVASLVFIVASECVRGLDTGIRSNSGSLLNAAIRSVTDEFIHNTDTTAAIVGSEIPRGR
mgnify:CR=1 FL=1